MRLPGYRVLAALAAEPGQSLPWAWRTDAQRFLYGIFSGTLAGADAHRGRYSLFTFSLLPQKPVATPVGLESEDGTWLFRFASARKELLAMVYAALCPGGVLQLGAKSFAVTGVIKEPIGDGASVSVQPVLAAKLRSRGFWTPDDPEYVRAVECALANRWEYATGRKAPEIRFRFTSEPARKLIQYGGRDLLAFSGSARLDAPREIRLFAKHVGLGQKPSCGFGFAI